MFLFSLKTSMRYGPTPYPLLALFKPSSPPSTRKLRIVSFSPTCWIKSQNYIAAYRFRRLLSDICSGISKPTPEDFLNAYVDHQEEAGIPVCKETIVAYMLRHAKWLAEEAKRSVNVQSWNNFAKTGVLDLDEDRDVGMDELENDRLIRPIPDPPPRHGQVRPLTQL